MASRSPDVDDGDVSYLVPRTVADCPSDQDNTCPYAFDGMCDDGAAGTQYQVASATSACDCGTDTADCGQYRDCGAGDVGNDYGGGDGGTYTGTPGSEEWCDQMRAAHDQACGWIFRLSAFLIAYPIIIGIVTIVSLSCMLGKLGTVMAAPASFNSVQMVTAKEGI